MSLKQSKAARARKPREFARKWHSQARIEFVKASFCIVDGCEASESENAHVVKDEQKGMSRKAGYKCIAPLCRDHHHELDEVLGREQFEEKYGVDLQHEADLTQKRWERVSGDLEGMEEAP